MSTKVAVSSGGRKTRILARRGSAPSNSSAYPPPQEPQLTIDTPSQGSVVRGLLPIMGWGYTGSVYPPEGIVEMAFDDEETWAALKLRTRVAGISAEADWAKRGGFQAAVNTFLLENGEHRMRLRIRGLFGHVVLERELTIRVDNVGRLAETTTRLLKGHRKAKRIWTGLIDSTDFPYKAAKDVAWFDRADAIARVPEILARHELDACYAEPLGHFVNEGYLVLDDFIPKDWCDQVNRDLDSLIASGTLHYRHKGQRVEHLFEHSKATRDLWRTRKSSRSSRRSMTTSRYRARRSTSFTAVSKTPIKT